jgi:Asp-tRNA(Asn)/Glu-tRNA(Gln) amidotransferase A subunit family amidase
VISGNTGPVEIDVPGSAACPCPTVKADGAHRLWVPGGLPAGVRLVAAYGREDIMVRVASQLEQAAPWSGRHPPVHA